MANTLEYTLQILATLRAFAALAGPGLAPLCEAFLHRTEDPEPALHGQPIRAGEMSTAHFNPSASPEPQTVLSSICHIDILEIAK